MELYIRVKDNQPLGNPILGDNFRQAFPEVDTKNLPPEFARFIRVELPRIDRFEVYEGVTYEKVGDVYTDVHHVRPMTDDEKATKIEQIKAVRPGDNWRWDDERSQWLPPLMPTAGGPWRFDPQTKDWVVATEPPFPSWVLRDDGRAYVPPVPRPQDGQRYRWDESALSWVLLNV
jgi:hypothetical protein